MAPETWLGAWAAAEHAPWAWLVGGLALCGAEIAAPGVFLLWIGLAAIVVGLASFAAPIPPAWALVLFAALSVASSLVGRRVYGGSRKGAGATLNQGAMGLAGRVVVLIEPIVDGMGRAAVRDSVWRVKGPDAPAGARMRVTGVADGVVLVVERAEGT